MECNLREFAASLRRVATRATTNDADRRRKHLAKHGLTLQAIQTG
jgi:sigma54-dependent transcription regulator